MPQSFLKKIAKALRFDVKDADRTAALMESESDALALVGTDGDLIYMNRAGKSFFGILDLRTAVVDRLMPDEDSNRLAMAKLDAALKNKAETAVELLMQSTGGDADFWEWYSVSLRQTDVGTLWRVRDITAQRAMDAVMRQETQEMAEFLDALPIGLYQIDAGGVINFVNRRFCDWLGVNNPRELKGRKLVDLLAGNHVPELDGFWHGELTFRTQTGGTFTAFVSHAVYDENGETMLRASVVRDVTSREEHEQGAKDAEVGFSRLFEEAPVGIAFVDKDGVITEANSILFQLTGKTREELVGTKLEDCIDTDDWAELKDKMAKVMMAQLSRAHAEVKLSSETEKYAAVYITPMTEDDEDGKPDVFGFIAHFIDNTERRNLSI